jgi:hypothetical protein
VLRVGAQLGQDALNRHEVDALEKLAAFVQLLLGGRDRSDPGNQLAAAIDELYKIARRPGVGGSGSAVDDPERKDAEAHCRTRRALTIPKVEGNVASGYTPSPSEIDEALTARKAMRALWRHGDPSRLEPTEKKSLSSFAFGSNSFILSPQISNQVLSCLVDPIPARSTLRPSTSWLPGAQQAANRATASATLSAL